MPRGKHLPKASAKDQRQYEHILESEMKRGRSKPVAKRIAAATVRKGQKRNPTQSKGKQALRTTGRALKSATRGVLAAGSQILGAGAEALNPRRRNGERIWQVYGGNKTAKGAAQEFARTYWAEPRKITGYKSDGTFKVVRGLRTYRVIEDGDLYVIEVVDDPIMATGRRNSSKRKNKTIIKARTIKHLDVSKVHNPRKRNAYRIPPDAIKKFPQHMQDEYWAHWNKLEGREEKAATPKQKQAVAKAKRSFLSRLGTRLKVIGQTRKYKVSGRNLNKAPRKTIKVKARHETDALAKAKAKFGSGFDQIRIQNVTRHRAGNPTYTVSARKKNQHSAGQLGFGTHPLQKQKAAKLRQRLDRLNDRWMRATKASELAKIKKQMDQTWKELQQTGATNPKRKRNLDHRDSAHQVKVHQHWRAGGLSQWQRAHHAGQSDLFAHGIKAKPKRNAAGFYGNVWAYHKTEKRWHKVPIAQNWPSRKWAIDAAQRELKRLGKLSQYSKFKALPIGSSPNPSRPTKNHRRNQSPDAIRKDFAGSVSGSRDLYFPQGTPQGLAKLGKLVSIKTEEGTLKPVSGTAWLVCDTKGHLHIGTTQNKPLWDGQAHSFGAVKEVEYESAKPHLGFPNPIVFYHKLGEETGRKPTLHADGKGGLKFKGGAYRITSRGIEN